MSVITKIESRRAFCARRCAGRARFELGEHSGLNIMVREVAATTAGVPCPPHVSDLSQAVRSLICRSRKVSLWMLPMPTQSRAKPWAWHPAPKSPGNLAMNRPGSVGVSGRNAREAAPTSVCHHQLEKPRMDQTPSLEAPPAWPNGNELLNHFFPTNVPGFRRGHDLPSHRPALAAIPRRVDR